ncbi:hypothetical protein C5B90_06670 [Haloferax sp. Atlit-12N]|uniref:hypothetical protein n=1 Tax=Haloferax sp. Atlit-12N TaxID=2077203 RepID=UPI000E27DFBF|nr:hypothetical protein [Haloferax sp. Atlit-12N]RDZ66024.1 hypothetical protein C5B90_06670 [Haloferax sp. Atlit-12N]
MLGDLIADLILEVVFRPVLKAMDLFVAGVKKRLTRLRARFGGERADDGTRGDEGDGRDRIYSDAGDRERSAERY